MKHAKAVLCFRSSPPAVFAQQEGLAYHDLEFFRSLVLQPRKHTSPRICFALMVAPTRKPSIQIRPCEIRSSISLVDESCLSTVICTPYRSIPGASSCAPHLARGFVKSSTCAGARLRHTVPPGSSNLFFTRPIRSFNRFRRQISFQASRPLDFEV